MQTKTSFNNIPSMQLPKIRPMTLHCLHLSKQYNKISPENRIIKNETLTLQSSIIIKRLQPNCRQRKVHLRTISLSKINSNHTKKQILLNQSLDVKGWSNKSVMELFDI